MYMVGHDDEGIHSRMGKMIGDFVPVPMGNRPDVGQPHDAAPDLAEKPAPVGGADRHEVQAGRRVIVALEASRVIAVCVFVEVHGPAVAMDE